MKFHQSYQKRIHTIWGQEGIITNEHYSVDFLNYIKPHPLPKIIYTIIPIYRKCVPRTQLYIFKSYHAGADTFILFRQYQLVHLAITSVSTPFKKTPKSETDKQKYTETFGSFSSLLSFQHTSFLSFFFTCFYCEFGKPTR